MCKRLDRIVARRAASRLAAENEFKVVVLDELTDDEFDRVHDLYYAEALTDTEQRELADLFERYPRAKTALDEK
jgi:hypothetical protein